MQPSNVAMKITMYILQQQQYESMNHTTTLKKQQPKQGHEEEIDN